MSDTPTQPPPPHEPGEVRRHLNARIPLPHIRRRRPDGAAVRTCLGLTLAAACGAAAYTLVMGPEHIVDIAPLPLGSAPTAVQAGTPATPIRSLQTARSESMYAPALSTSTLLDSRMAEERVTRVVVTVKAHAGEERDLRLSAVAHVLPEDQTSTPTTGWPNNVALDRVSVGVRLGACTDSSHALLAQVPVSNTDKPAQRSFRLPAHTTYRNLSIWIEDHGRRRCMNPSQVAEEYNDTDADAAWFHARCGRQAQVQLPGLDSRLRPAGSPPGRSLAAQRYPDIELPMDPLARASAFPRGQCRKIAHRLAKAWRERLGSAPELGYFWDGQLR